MRLFHITCRHHIVKIMEDRVLNTTESNIGAPEIMNLDLHRKIAEKEGVGSNDAPLVMVWNPSSDRKEEVLTMPREILAKAERMGVKFKRLTPEEIEAETKGSPTYKARIVLDYKPDQELDGKYGDVFSDTDATDDDLSPYGEHVGPDVVWLTRDATPRQIWATPVKHTWEDMPDQYRKDSVLIAVEVPDEEVHKWSEWAFDQGINPKWYESLSMGVDEHENWYVVARPIPIEEWVGIWDARTGQVAWLPPGTLPEGQQNDLGVPYEEFTYDVPMPDAWLPTRLQKSNPYKKSR